MALSYRGRPSTGLDYLNSDTTLTKLFVGGLAWETQSPTLHSYFRQFGEILEAVVITDKNTGRSKGYGFVSLSLSLSLHVFVPLCSLILLISTRIMLR